MPECILQVYHQGVKFIIIIIIILSIGFATDLESAEPLRDFLCIAFVVCTCVRHVPSFLYYYVHFCTQTHVQYTHVLLMSLCSFCNILNFTIFLYQTIQPDLVVLDGQQATLL